MVKYVHFQSRNIQFGCYLRRTDVIHEVVLHHPCIRQKCPEWVKIMENLVGHERNVLQAPVLIMQYSDRMISVKSWALKGVSSFPQSPATILKKTKTNHCPGMQEIIKFINKFDLL